MLSCCITKKKKKKVITVRVKIVVILGVEMVIGGHSKEEPWDSSTILHFNLGDGCLTFLFVINPCFLFCLFFCVIFHYYFKNQKKIQLNAIM